MGDVSGEHSWGEPPEEQWYEQPPDDLWEQNVTYMPGVEPENGVPRTSPYVSGTRYSDAPSPPSLFYDVAALLSGGIPDPPSPVLGFRTDGHGLFYGGQVNVVFGDAEGGKTWICLAAVVEALTRGRTAIVIDLDHNGPEATVDRLLELGAPEGALGDLDRFRYVEPEDGAHLIEAVKASVLWRPAVAIVDSVGELLPILGYSSNSPDDFTSANRRVMTPLAKAGAAVVAIDHLAKNVDSRTAGATGTTAKKRTVGGVSLRVVAKEPFAPGRGGKAHLTINKDRHGGLRRNCPPPDGGEAYAGTFILEPDMTWRIAAPTSDDKAPSNAVPGDLAALSRLDPPPKSVRDVKSRLNWATDRAREALAEWRTSVPDTGVEVQGTAPDEPLFDEE